MIERVKVRNTELRNFFTPFLNNFLWNFKAIFYLHEFYQSFSSLEKLSQTLTVVFANSLDIVEFVVDPSVRESCDLNVQYIWKTFWILSLLQFIFLITKPKVNSTANLVVDQWRTTTADLKPSGR